MEQGEKVQTPICFVEVVRAYVDERDDFDNDESIIETSQVLQEEVASAYQRIKDRVQHEKLVLLSTRQQEFPVILKGDCYIVVIITAHVIPQAEMEAFQRRQELTATTDDHRPPRRAS